MVNCPVCNSELRFYYSLSREAMFCYCPNTACVLELNVEGSGDCTKEAQEDFLKKAKKVLDGKSVK